MKNKALLKRFETAEKMGLLTPEVFKLMERWLDSVMRLEGGQFHHWYSFLESEAERTDRFAGHKTLANDNVGYRGIHLMAILTHPCQLCAEDPKAWHTRSGFCPHKPKISDVAPFKHGEEGTHFACADMANSDGPTQCCGCTNHKCQREAGDSK
jgi:hypothetical protein